METKNEFLSVEDLTRQEEGDYTEVYAIITPRKQGKILIRPIRSTTEMEEISALSSKIQKGKKNLPTLQNISDQDIYAGILLHKCIVAPSLNMDQAIALVNTLGPESRSIMFRIMKLSGIDANRLSEEEDKLKEDPFSSIDALDLRGIFAPAPLRSSSDNEAISGVKRVSLPEDKETGRVIKRSHDK